MNEKHHRMIGKITSIVKQANLDNITRTIAYEQYYEENKEIQWAFLASMVSRNAGWNMTDLEGAYFPLVLPTEKRKQIFYTYERANWLIFQDAFPQLLIYAYSKKLAIPLFELLRFFHVSRFMIDEWQVFWEKQDQERLMTALIINEQWTIQKPVVEHPFYAKHIFSSFLYKTQDAFQMSYIVFPTVTGNLIGSTVTNFKDVEKRIELGKKLAQVLFHPIYYHLFYTFAKKTPPTGSRIDYEQYFKKRKQADTPFLRQVYAPIFHRRSTFEDWSSSVNHIEKYFGREPCQPEKIKKVFLWKRNSIFFLFRLQKKARKKIAK